MRIRTLSESGDWTFGKGLNNYSQQDAAIGQNIRSRLLSWEGDCFWALQEGVDWRNLLGKGSQNELEFAIKTNILQAYGVVKINKLSLVLNEQRKLNIQYEVETIYGSVFNATIEQGV